jgi:IclR family transcriptional regulator, acetate operon repressor
MSTMQSADRALAILAAFNEGRPDVGVSELAAELGMHKSTASRLLATLQARGLVRRDGDRFLPGPELARLGGLAIRGLALVDVAKAPLARLAEECGEAVNLAIRENGQVLNVYQVGSSHFVGMADWTGRVTPLHCTANGKVLLAFGGGSLPPELPALTPRTITDVPTLRTQLESVREHGFAVAVEELELGLHSVAAPIFDWSGACAAAVSVAGPAYRLPEARLEALGSACIAAAGEVSACLGFSAAA